MHAMAAEKIIQTALKTMPIWTNWFMDGMPAPPGWVLIWASILSHGFLRHFHADREDQKHLHDRHRDPAQDLELRDQDRQPAAPFRQGHDAAPETIMSTFKITAAETSMA